MQSHKVDVTLDVIDRKEVAHHIEQHTTILETGIILNLDLRQARQNARLRGEQLDQRLHAIEYTRSVVTLDRNTLLLSDFQAISTRNLAIAQIDESHSVRERFHDSLRASLCGLRYYDLQRHTEIVIGIVGQIFGRELQIGLGADHRLARQQIAAIARNDGLDGFGNDVELCFDVLSRADRSDQHSNECEKFCLHCV